LSEFFDRVAGQDRLLQLFDEDPELFEGLPPGRSREAQAGAVARPLRLDRGRWDGTVPGSGPAAAHLGLLVVEGLLVRSVTVARRPLSELVGAGDLIRPWQQDGEAASIPFAIGWEVNQPALLAVLDSRFMAAACRWPELISALVGRAVRRSQGLAIQLAIADLRRVEERLVLLFWHLADRWGRVAPEGVIVPLRLTHDVIAQLVCAQRPTVTAALQVLDRDGRLQRRRDRSWLLSPELPPPPRGLSSRRCAVRRRACG
jgi:CRP/FNR family cyclic AMP-dependent transcriptional regulator